MGKFKSVVFCLLCILIVSSASARSKKQIVFVGSASNDLHVLLEKEKVDVRRFDNAEDGVKAAKKGGVIIIVADNYPQTKVAISESLIKKIKSKKLKAYIEYPSYFTGLNIPEKPINTQLERGVVTSDVFGAQLKPLSILGINDAYVLPVDAKDPLIILAKVVGFNKAEYGIDDVKKHPLLFKADGMFVATTKLTNFATGRYGPNESWKEVWNHIFSELTGRDFKFTQWVSYIDPMYSATEPLPADAKKNSVKRGVDWFDKALLYIHPSWKDMYLKYQGDGENPYGPPVSQDSPNGDGTLGLLEGHASKVYHDGSQQYRYWIRADVQGEASFALAAASNLLGTPSYNQKADRLIDYMFKNSNLRGGPRNDKNSPSYGLIGWSVTHPGVYYGDDNARALLGIIGASAYMNTDKWDKETVEAIIANFRTTGSLGFRGERQEDKDLQKLGWQHYWERDITHYAPHFESWTWATYLWLYDKTGYKPLLEKTKHGIKMMMEGYPNKWVWTNGIQQERARMILPLAWLVRIEDTEEHRQWLDTLVKTILENQDESGAIREELGAGKGRFGVTLKNEDYGKHEAPLIFENGDPVADMLYTSNFAFFSLNEAAHATGNKEYKEAVDKLSNFLTRIQVKSDKHKDLDGAWFRAFEYDRWEYWASNADAGWGAWGTLSGWTQSWIVATQVMTGQNQNFWDLTQKSKVKKHMDPIVKEMFDTKRSK